MKEERKQFRYEGRLIYEWDEGLDSVLVFIAAPPVPPNVKLASTLQIVITAKELRVGLKQAKPYLQHQFQGIVDSEESLWYIQEGKENQREIVIELQKAQKGVRWSCVFKGHEQLDPLEQEQLKKKIMLERFQEENPGFDFSGAEFNGKVPEARTFMGGVK